MHYVQKRILDTLRAQPSVRYAQLNTQKIESGHFRYHLEQLVKDGSVQQIGRGLYALTAAGQSLVDRLSRDGVKPKLGPKVITYTLLRDGKKILLQKKTKEPYLGLYNMIGGKVHQGEQAQDAAAREVFEKTGQVIATPKLVGIFEIIINHKDAILTHAVAYVFVAKVEKNDYVKSGMRAFSPEELETADNLAPDFLPIFQKIDDLPIQSELRWCQFFSLNY